MCDGAFDDQHLCCAVHDRHMGLCCDPSRRRHTDPPPTHTHTHAHARTRAHTRAHARTRAHTRARPATLAIQEHSLLLYLDQSAYLLLAIDERRALELLTQNLDTLPPGACACAWPGVRLRALCADCVLASLPHHLRDVRAARARVFDVSARARIPMTHTHAHMHTRMHAQTPRRRCGARPAGRHGCCGGQGR
jgi:hypothetical protein